MKRIKNDKFAMMLFITTIINGVGYLASCILLLILLMINRNLEYAGMLVTILIVTSLFAFFQVKAGLNYSLNSRWRTGAFVLGIITVMESLSDSIFFIATSDYYTSVPAAIWSIAFVVNILYTVSVCKATPEVYANANRNVKTKVFTSSLLEDLKKANSNQEVKADSNEEVLESKEPVAVKRKPTTIDLD